MYECKKSEQYDMADVPTYEEVTPHRRQSGAKHRLVVLVGPTGVGLNELKRKLLISDPQHFGVTVPRLAQLWLVMGHGMTIKHLRTAEFKPYVVFVKPPPIERLRESRRNAKVISGKDDKGSAKPFSMESQHGHLFEKIIVNDDLTAAFSELKVALKKVETDSHWVPISWTHS
ncbi:unnamed protein product, partial [Coregonus sp. 'balchen']